MLIYLSKIKLPPSGAAKWWKDEMRRRVTQTVEKEMGMRVTVHGVRWHYSHRLERALDIELPAIANAEKVIVQVIRIGFQSWDIRGSIVEDFIIPDLDGGKRGDRASQRAEDIAKANKWKLAIRAATWLGQHNSREHYEGKPTGLQLTIISKDTPTEMGHSEVGEKPLQLENEMR